MPHPDAFDPNDDALPRFFDVNRELNPVFAKRLYNKTYPKTFFHYTTPDALIAILEGEEMWLSEATYLNDRNEIRHGEAIAIARLQSAIDAQTEDEPRTMLLAVADLFQSKKPPAVYVACFSWDGDSLGQWRGYAHGGVAIEVEHSPLMFGYTSEGTYSEVRYDRPEEQWIFDELITAYARAFAEDVRDPRLVKRRGPPLTVEEERAICASKLYHDLWRHVVVFKSDAFQSEREVRFVYTAHDFSNNEKWYPVHQKPRFRVKDGRIIPYLTSRMLNFANMDTVREAPPLPIRSVVIGPREDQAVLERGIRSLLDVTGHGEAIIRLSHLSLRF